MSDAVEANLALAHRAYEAWNEGGMEAVAEYLAPDAVVHPAPEAPDQGVRPIAVRVRQLSAAMGDLRLKVRSLEGIGEYVLAVLEMTAEGSASGALVAAPYFQLVRWEDGRVREIRGFFDADQAQREYERLAGSPSG